jgi:hypothetical protein
MGSLIAMGAAMAGQKQAQQIVLTREKVDETKAARVVTSFYQCYPGAKVKEFTIVTKVLYTKEGLDSYQRDINAAGWVRTGVKERDMMESGMVQKAKADICEGKPFSKEWKKEK